MEGLVDSTMKNTLSFEWKLFECPDEYASCEEVDMEQFKDQIITGTKSLYFDILPNSYVANQWYEIRFRAYRSPSIFGQASERFLVNESPKAGKTYEYIPEISCILIDCLSCVRTG